MKYIDLVQSREFIGSDLPAIVWCFSAIAWLYDAYHTIDGADPSDSTSTAKRVRRNHLQSFFLTMLWMVGGGSLANIITMKVPGWAANDIVLGYMGVAWLLMRSSVIRRVTRVFIIPCILISHFFRAHLIITLLHVTSLAVGPKTIIGPILLSIIGSRGGGWLAQLILNATGDQCTRTTSDWGTKIPAGLKIHFWTALIYFFAMDIGGNLNHGTPFVSYAIANPAMILVCVLDGLFNEILGWDINFYAPLDYLISRLYQLLAWVPRSSSSSQKMAKLH